MENQTHPNLDLAEIEIRYMHSTMQTSTVFIIILISISTAQHYMIVVLFTLLFLLSARLPWQLRQERAIQQEANPTSPDEGLQNYANDKQLIDLNQKLMMKTLFHFIATIAIGFLMYSPK
jgi:hypothetical protein